MSRKRNYPYLLIITCVLLCCRGRERAIDIAAQLSEIELASGDIALCGSGPEEFGTVSFATSCSGEAQSDFNLAMALLHSFEYTEAEKVFARIIKQDPGCAMAYWGVAMSTFHPLWAPPTQEDLAKGEKILSIARSLMSDSASRESGYIEAIAAIYDEWKTTAHKTRINRFERASAALYQKYPADDEAAIFYALALATSADPTDKTFVNQLKAGTILNRVKERKPDHPGIVHYIIHVYDYPELAHLALPAARKYASIAAASAHAQHMPSHIFTRMGFWDESINSNLKSVAAAQCYAEQSGMQGHWDEELHGLDYLLYAYLQKGNDIEARKCLDYLHGMSGVSPLNFKGAYSFAASSARYAVERKDWEMASHIELVPKDFPWEKFPWEVSNVHFSRFLGAIQLNRIEDARVHLAALEENHRTLLNNREDYKANLVDIQVKACKAWMLFAQGKKSEAIVTMTEAAEMEEGTAKHPVTPGEIIPARELLGDLYLAIGDALEARNAYQDDLKKHPNKLNDIFGIALASERLGDRKTAAEFYQQVLALADGVGGDRLQVIGARKFLSGAGF